MACPQVFRQQADSAKIAQQQRRHASKVKLKEAVIISQIEAEEQTHQRTVAARKVLPSPDMPALNTNSTFSSKDVSCCRHGSYWW